MARTKAAKRPKGPKAKQAFIAGMEPESIPEIDHAADNFVEARNAWQALKYPMMETKAILEALMKKNKLKTYEYDGKIVQFITDEKLKVNVKKPEKIEVGEGTNGDGEEDDDDE